MIGNAATNALTGGYRSVVDGIIVCATVIGWNYVLESLSLHYSFIRRWTQPPAVALVSDGKLQRRNMRRELVSEQELDSHLRKHHIYDFADVKQAFKFRQQETT